jgi:hypothetical protein
VKEEEECKERNVKINVEEEIDDETEASAMQSEEDSDKLLLLHVQLIRLFDLSLECNKGPKHLLLRKGKTVTLF